MRFAAAFLAVAIACTLPATTPPLPVARDTLYVVDTVLAVDTVTVETRVVVPLAVTVAPAPLSDSIYSVRQLRVKPDSAKVTPGLTQQFCPFIVFKAGQWAQPAEYAAIPECRAHYLAITERWRQPNALQQFVADRVCIKWEATGGTVTATAC